MAFIAPIPMPVKCDDCAFQFIGEKDGTSCEGCSILAKPVTSTDKRPSECPLRPYGEEDQREKEKDGTVRNIQEIYQKEREDR